MGIKKKLVQLKALSFSEFLLLMKSTILLPLIALSLKFKGYKWTQSYLESHVSNRGTDNAPDDNFLEQAQNVARIVSIASHHGAYRATCLKQSLLTRWLLARRGIQTDLRIGVDNSDEFRAHAWVEYQGVVIVDRSDIADDFSAFTST